MSSSSPKEFLIDKVKRDNLKDIKYLTDMLQSITNISEVNAKTIIYYCMATYHISEFHFFPCMAFIGPFSSGKSELVDFASKLCYKPTLTSGHATMTAAGLRNVFQETCGETLIMDEAALNPNSSEFESLIIGRTTKTASNIAFNEPQLIGKGGVKYDLQTHSIFGAFIFNARSLILDSAAGSRSIVIPTKYNPQGKFTKVKSMIISDLMLPENKLWYPPEDIPRGTRAYDIWEPLMQVAANIEDDGWINYVRTVLDNAQLKVAVEHQDEDNQVVLAAIIQAFTDMAGFFKVDTKLKVQDISDNLTKNFRGENWNPKRIRKILQSMNLEVKKYCGTNYLYTTLDQLKSIATDIGYEDEILKV